MTVHYTDLTFAQMRTRWVLSSLLDYWRKQYPDANSLAILSADRYWVCGFVKEGIAPGCTNT